MTICFEIGVGYVLTISRYHGFVLTISSWRRCISWVSNGVVGSQAFAAFDQGMFFEATIIIFFSLVLRLVLMLSSNLDETNVLYHYNQ